MILLNLFLTLELTFNATLIRLAEPNHLFLLEMKNFIFYFPHLVIRIICAHSGIFKRFKEAERKKIQEVPSPLFILWYKFPLGF